MMKQLACLVLFFSGTFFLRAQGPSTSFVSEVDSIISAYYQSEQFNGSLLIALDGEKVYDKDWGYADLETGSALNSSSQYYIASISKIFTSTAVHLLHKEGQLSISDLITKYLTGLPACFHSLTVQHLLTHTGGIPEEPGGWKILINTDNTDVMEFLGGVEKLDFEPGTEYSYSNNGYVLLAQLIEKVSGQTYKAFLENNILEKAGMEHSFVVSRNMPKTELHVAKSYNEGIQADWPLYRLGPAGIYSTSRDLYRWDQAFFHNEFFTPLEIEQILTPVEVDGKAQYYGLGWGILDMDGERYLGHTGGTFGFRTLYEHQLKKNNTLIIFTNIGDVVPLMEIRNRLNQVMLKYGE